MILVVTAGFAQDLQQRQRRVVAGPCGPGIGNFQTGFTGQLFDCLGEAEMLELHEKCDRSTAHTTAEAMIELFGSAYCERGCFLVVKWAEADEVCAGALELEERADDVNDVACVANLLDRGLGNDGQGRSGGRGSLVLLRISQ